MLLVGSPAYRACCPGDKAPITLIDKEGVKVPVPSSSIKKEHVAFVRQQQKRVHFVSASYEQLKQQHYCAAEPNSGLCVAANLVPPVILLANLTMGINFNGVGVAQEMQPFADLSLEIDTTPIVMWKAAKISEYVVTEWLKNVNEEVLVISDAIRKYW